MTRHDLSSTDDVRKQTLSGVSVIIPAGGRGVRMGSDRPKQYLPLAGRTVIEHTVETFLALSPDRVVVVLAPDDDTFSSLGCASRCEIASAGRERWESVRNGIASVNPAEDDWIMVHDAVRPCVNGEAVLSLYAAVAVSDVGGLLAIPAVDTVKRVDGTTVVETLDRRVLWQAQTPQLFRAGLLMRALAGASDEVTDEASAVEQLGAAPVVVEGHRYNIKITTPEDLAIAAMILESAA